MSLREKIYDMGVGVQTGVGVEQTTLDTVPLASRPSHNPNAGGTSAIPTSGSEFGNDAVFKTAEYGTAIFDVILTPVAAAGDVPAWAPFFRAGQFAGVVDAGVSYSLMAAAGGSPALLTAVGHHDKNRYKYIDAIVNSLSMKFAANQLPTLSVGLIAQNCDLDEHATPAVSAYTVPSVVEAGTTVLTLAGRSFCFSDAAIDFGLKASSPGAWVCGGALDILDMMATFTGTLKDEGVNEFKWLDKIGKEAVSFSLTHGMAGGGRITVASAAAQVTSADGNSTNDGAVGVGLGMNFLKGGVPTIVID